MRGTCAQRDNATINVDRKNPFDVEQISAEYFICGFLKTEIFVADSCVTEVLKDV